MRMSIIPDDLAVYVDGKRALVDMKGIPAEVHAVQWYGDHGWVEFKRNRNGQKDNKMITGLGAYAKFLTRWKEVRIEDLQAVIDEIGDDPELEQVKQRLVDEIKAVNDV